MKKGFTLIEIITVIIILGIVGLITIPAVSVMIKESEEDLYNNQLAEIKLASEKWAYNNLDKLPTVEGKSVTITLLELKRGGYLPLNIKDPRTDELIPNGLSIVITYSANDYIYTIKEVISNTTITEESPSIILSGEALVRVEINSTYIQTIATATDSDKNDISDDIIITYYNNGNEVATVDTSKLNTYTVEYSVTDKNKNLTTVITQTVIIEDTIKPVITVPEKITINVSEAVNYDLMNGVTVTDNSNEDIQLGVSGFDASVGEKTVNYTGCDSSGNCTTKGRLIVVE